jgi:dihydrofolate reductase
MTHLTIIVATDAGNGIGIRNTIPWHLPEDLAYFKRSTSGHPILMGRKTFDSIGKPLPNRRNIVITHHPGWQHDGVETATSLDTAIQSIEGQDAFIIGGAQIYTAAMPLVTRLMITAIDRTFDCDTFFPVIDPQQWKEISREKHHSAKNGFDYAFVTYERS